MRQLPQPSRNRPIRFLVLALLSAVVLANMYSFNNPQALQSTLMDYLDINETQFNLLYSFVALPNIVCPFLLGMAIDRIGTRVMLVALTFLVMVCQAVVAIGVARGDYHTMLLGRVLFGVAIESVSVAQVCLVSEWFLGRQLAVGIGMATTFPELGNALNSLLTPIIYQRSGSVSLPFFVSVCLCGVSFGIACVVAHIDQQAELADQDNNIMVVTQLSQSDSKSASQQYQQQGININDLKQFSSTFWLLVVLCSLVNCQYIPFLDNVNQLFQVRFCFSQVTAGQDIMVTYLVTSLIGLPIGFLADYFGYKRYSSIAGMCVLFLAHLTIYLYPQCMGAEAAVHWCGASWGLLLLGLGYCMYANCIISCVPLVVSKRVTGSAFGLLLVFENLAMAVCPVLSSIIVRHAQSQWQGYRGASLFFSVVGLLGVLASLLMLCIKQADKRVLDGTYEDKKVFTVRRYPSFSDDEYIQQNRPSLLSEEGLDVRLMKFSSCIELPSGESGKEITTEGLLP